MKKEYVIYGIMAFFVIALICAVMKKEKYQIMSASHASSYCSFTLSSQLENFCEKHNVIDVEMKDGYVLIHYN